jgi:hypothetical protein
VKATVRGDVVEAFNVTGPALMATFDGVAKVIVWDTSVTWKVWLMGAATAYVVLPGCVAWMIQAPADTSVSVVPDTVQTGSVLEAKATVRPELDEAFNVTGPALMATSDGVAKVIVWDISVDTLKDTVAVPTADAPVASVPSVAVTTTVQFASAGAVLTLTAPEEESIVKPSLVLAESREYTMVPVLPVATTVASTPAGVPVGCGVAVGTGMLRATLSVKL